MTVERIAVLEIRFVVSAGEEGDDNAAAVLAAIAADESGEVRQGAENLDAEAQNVAEHFGVAKRRVGRIVLDRKSVV